MNFVQKRVHKLKGKKVTFDNLTVGIMAVVCVNLMFNGYTPESEASEISVSASVLGGLEDVYTLNDVTDSEGVESGDAVGISGNGDGEETIEKEIGEEHVNNTLALTGLDDFQVDFINKLAPVAIEVASEYNVYPSIVVAQAILESDWGRSSLAVDANNLFGIKGSFEGAYVNHETQEDDGTGFKYTITDKFAKYPTYRESVENNAQLIRNGVSFDAEYYAGAWVENTVSYKDATLALTGTYATDINYNTKVNGVIEDYNLDALDK